MRIWTSCVFALFATSFVSPALADWMAGADQSALNIGQGSGSELKFLCNNGSPKVDFKVLSDAMPKKDGTLTLSSGTDAPRRFAAKFGGSGYGFADYVTTEDAARSIITMALLQRGLTGEIEVGGELFGRNQFDSAGIDAIGGAVGSCFKNGSSAEAAPNSDSTVAPSSGDAATADDATRIFADGMGPLGKQFIYVYFANLGLRDCKVQVDAKTQLAIDRELANLQKQLSYTKQQMRDFRAVFDPAESVCGDPADLQKVLALFKTGNFMPPSDTTMLAPAAD